MTGAFCIKQHASPLSSKEASGVRSTLAVFNSANLSAFLGFEKFSEGPSMVPKPTGHLRILSRFIWHVMIATKTDDTRDRSCRHLVNTTNVKDAGDVKALGRRADNNACTRGPILDEKDANGDLEKGAESLVTSPKSRNRAILKLSVPTFIILLFAIVGFWPRWIGELRSEE